MSTDKSSANNLPADAGRPGVSLQTVSTVLLMVASLAPMLTAAALTGTLNAEAAVGLGAGGAVAIVLSLLFSRLMTKKLGKMSKLMVSLTKPQSVESMLKTERELSKLGGAMELRESQFAMRKILHGFIRVSKAKHKS